MHELPERVFEKMENILEVNSEEQNNGSSRNYVALFKEPFFGNCVDFLLNLKTEDKYLYLTIKMEKKNLKIEMNYEELHTAYDFIGQTIEDYFKELI